MKPINQAERRKAFLNFLLFFIITVGVIITAVIFSVQVPLKENDQMRNAMSKVEKEKQVAENIGGKIESTINILDSINNPGVNANMMDGDITENLQSLRSMIKNDSTLNSKTLYESILYGLSKWQKGQSDLRAVSISDQEKVALQKQIEDVKKERDQYVLLYNQLLIQRAK